MLKFGGGFTLKDQNDQEVMASIIAKLCWELNHYHDVEEVFEIALKHIHDSRTPKCDCFIDVNSMEKMARLIRASIEIPENAKVN